MTMNLDRHMQAHKDMFLHLVRGDGDSAEKHREFYDEYLAVMDLTAEFYLQTVDTVFVQHMMPRGLMTHRGRPVDLAAITRPALMTVEGEKDDITGTGQCRAAHDLCANVAAERKERTSNARRSDTTASSTANASAPRLRRAWRKFIRAHDPCASTDLSIAQLEHMATMPRARPQARARARRAGVQLSALCLTRSRIAYILSRCAPHGAIYIKQGLNDADCLVKIC